MQYRRELDGLRALAVVPVILFHAGIPLFKGGYVGVDVFFVISGYLIASIISQDLENGNFKFLAFYERRIRRILPVLLLVCLVSIPFAWFILSPSNLKEFSESLVSISILSPNILFSLQTDYFGSGAEMQPLLNTWSLGVEEQFYLVFPLLFWLLWRCPRLNTTVILGLLSIASFALMKIMLLYYPNVAFYSFPTRAWELMLGVLAALLLKGRQLTRVSRLWASIAASIGLLLIVLSFFWLDKNTAYPGYSKLMPASGAFLIVLFGSHDSVVKRLLSCQLLVSIGLISYSAYLWHHPIFAFARHYALGPLGVEVIVLLLGLTLALSYLTWHLIEKPFRRPVTVSRWCLYVYVCSGLATIAIFGSIGHFSGGYPGRVINGVAMEEVRSDLAINFGLSEGCEGINVSGECSFGLNPSAVLWGDSYAMHMADALKSSGTELSFSQYAFSSCSPIVGLSIVGGSYSRYWADNCLNFNQRVFDLILGDDRIDLVIISSMFNFSEYDLFDGQRRLTYSKAIAVANLTNTLTALESAGKKVVIVSPTPSPGRDVGRCLARAKITRQPLMQCDFDVEELSANYQEAMSLLGDISKEGFKVFELKDLICSAEHCSAAMEGVFIFRDKGHLSKQGSAFLGRKFDIAKTILEL